MHRYVLFINYVNIFFSFYIILYLTIRVIVPWFGAKLKHVLLFAYAALELYIMYIKREVVYNRIDIAGLRGKTKIKSPYYYDYYYHLHPSIRWQSTSGWWQHYNAMNLHFNEAKKYHSTGQTQNTATATKQKFE